MKILFYDTQSYDRESFDRTKEQFPEIEVEYLKTGLAARTASLAKGYDAVCAFVNSDVGTKTVEALHEAGVKLILMRCAGFNNVDLKTAAKYGIDVRRVPGYSPEAVAEHAMTLAMTVNRHMHKAYTKVRENDFSLGGLMGFNFYQKTAGIVGTGKMPALPADGQHIPHDQPREHQKDERRRDPGQYVPRRSGKDRRPDRGNPCKKILRRRP